MSLQMTANDGSYSACWSQHGIQQIENHDQTLQTLPTHANKTDENCGRWRVATNIRRLLQ